MPDAGELLKEIKKAANEATEASKPVQICFGAVTAVSPIQIMVEQKLPLGAAQLILTRNVTDYSVPVTVNWTTDSASGGSGEEAYASHSHSITGQKQITIHNGLAVGDNVILLREQGGQRYIVLDRIT